VTSRCRARRGWRRVARARIATRCARHRGLDIDGTLGEPVAVWPMAWCGSRGSTCPAGCDRSRCRPRNWRTRSVRRSVREAVRVCPPHRRDLFLLHALNSYACTSTIGSRRAIVWERSGVQESKSRQSPALENSRQGPGHRSGPDSWAELVIPPQDTVAHELAMQSKKLRLSTSAARAGAPTWPQLRRDRDAGQERPFWRIIA